MKDTQKKKITRNYHLLRRVEPWKCCRMTASICPNCSGIQTNAWNISKKKVFLSPEIVKWNSFMFFLLMMMNSASAGLQVLWMWAACISLHTFRRTLRVSGPEGDEVESNAMLAVGGGGAGGWHWRVSIPQYRKKSWEIPKYRVKNRWNTGTAFIFGHAYLKVYLSRVFVYLKHFCAPAINLSHQPAPAINIEFSRFNDRKACPTNFIIDYLSEIV